MLFGKRHISAHNQNGCFLSPDDLRGDHGGGGWLAAPDLQLTAHLAPDTRVTPQ